MRGDQDSGKPTAILFDVDGTLYDRTAHREYLRHIDRVTGGRVQAFYGEPDAERGFLRLVLDLEARGFGSKSEALQALFGIGLAEMNRFRDAHTAPEAHLRPDPMLVETLAILAARFDPMVIGTNNSPALARRILACLGVDPGIFRAIHTSEDLGAAKPDPRFFEEIKRREGLPGEAFLCVGDSVRQDIVPAERAGMQTWLVTGIADVHRLREFVTGRKASA